MTFEIEGVPRHQMENPFHFTPLQLAKRTQDLKAMKRDFPTIDPIWASWMWDFVERTPKDEVERIVNEKLWEKPSKYKATGGILKTALTLDSDGITRL